MHKLEIFLMMLYSFMHPLLACAFLQGNMGGVTIVFPGLVFVFARLYVCFFSLPSIKMLFNPTSLCRPTVLCSIRKHRK